MRCIALVVNHRELDGALFHAAWNLDAALEVEVLEDCGEAMAWLVRRVLDLGHGHAGVAYLLPPAAGTCVVAGNVWHRRGKVQASIEGEETVTYWIVDGRVARFDGEG